MDTESWDVMWMDYKISSSILCKMDSYQRINHFLGMNSITHKNSLAKNLKKLYVKFPKEYKFFPKTWILPKEIQEFT